MRKALLNRITKIAGVSCLLVALTTQAADLIPHPDGDAADKLITKSVFPQQVAAPSGNKKGETSTATPTVKADACETVARRVHDLCMASPGADPSSCLRDYDDAYRKCSRPPGGNGDGEGESSATERSEGVYRIPYADGTKVHISRDFDDHNPPGKIDMAGRGGGTYRVVAAAAGHLRYIVDNNSKQQHPLRWLRNTDDCFNNYVWIEHANGEWSKYSHLQQGTTTGKAGLKVGDYVAEGTYLGDEGKVGCAWPAHLHFEVVVPPSPNPGIGDPSGELKGYSRAHARNPLIAGIEGRTFKDGQNYTAAPQPKCRNDGDCGAGSYCNAGVDVTKNLCLPLKNDNDPCDLVGGGHQCKSGQCKFARCYTPKSVEMGDTCYSDDACQAGKCSDIDGVKGVCVCREDGDCGPGKWCDAGFDSKINACRAKLDKGQSCGKAGSVGNDHKCKSGKCSGFPNYKCK